jgi:hypothetical protein
MSNKDTEAFKSPILRGVDMGHEELIFKTDYDIDCRSSACAPRAAEPRVGKNAGPTSAKNRLQ